MAITCHRDCHALCFLLMLLNPASFNQDFPPDLDLINLQNFPDLDKRGMHFCLRRQDSALLHVPCCPFLAIKCPRLSRSMARLIPRYVQKFLLTMCLLAYLHPSCCYYYYYKQVKECDLCHSVFQAKFSTAILR